MYGIDTPHWSSESSRQFPVCGVMTDFWQSWAGSHVLCAASSVTSNINVNQIQFSLKQIQPLAWPVYMPS